MSKILLEFARNFVDGTMTAEEFANVYAEKWRQERDSGLSASDDDAVSEACSTTFLLADLYNPDDDRRRYELSAAQLRDKVAEVLAAVGTSD